jgi:hypothetical protein
MKLKKMLEKLGVFSEEFEDKLVTYQLSSTKEVKEGIKLDQGKLRYTLLPFKAITEVVKVLEFGAKKYEKDNWQKVTNGKERYLDAALRHLVAYLAGEAVDKESGLHHLAHATCCILFTLWLDLTSQKDANKVL